MSKVDEMMNTFREANNLFHEVYYGEANTENACERLVQTCLKIGEFVAKCTKKTLEDSYQLTMYLVCDLDRAYSFVYMNAHTL